MQSETSGDDSISVEVDGEAIRNLNAPEVTEDTETELESTHGPQQQPKAFKSPKRPQFAKRKKMETDPRVELAFNYLQTAAALASAPKDVKDECTTFDDYVAAEIRKLDPQIRAIAKHRISSMLFEL